MTLAPDGEEEGGGGTPSNPPGERSQKPAAGKSKRGRGRPPTTAQFVGLYKAKRDYVAEAEKEIRLQAEKELLAQEAARRECRRILASSLAREAEELDADELKEEKPRRRLLMQEALDGANTVLEVAKKSLNLKGTIIKMLKNAAGTIISASKELGTLAASQEVKALESENRVLKDRLKWMEREIETLKKEMRELRAIPPLPGPSVSEPEHTRDKPSVSSTKVEETSRDTAPRILKERRSTREKKGEKKENTGGKSVEATTETLLTPSPPPNLEDQGGIIEVDRVGQAVESMCLRDTPAQHAPTPAPEMSPEMELLMGSLIRQVGNMMAARFAAIEDRLVPEKILRPPLQADKGRKSVGTDQEGKGKEKAQPVETQRKEKRKERTNKDGTKKDKEGEKISPPPHPPPPLDTKMDIVPSPIPQTSQTSYAETVIKGKKGKKVTAAVKIPSIPKKDGTPVTTRASSIDDKVDGLSPSDKGPSKKGKRDRKTAAVVITVLPKPREEGEQLPSETPSMAKVLQEATTKVDIKELGIEYLRPKRAKTGGLILEVPGEGNTPKADRLAEKLREALSGNSEVRVTRPVAMKEMRISGLDDAATSGRVAAAVAETGGCTAGEVKVGEFRKAPSGLMAVWVRCPKNAADKAIKAGKIKMGWTVAKVEALQTRPLQCHRCLGFGHVKAKCPEEVDRSKNCYRCGLPGHPASGCVASPSCQLCAAKGREKGHRLGGPACPLSPNYKGKGGKGKRRRTKEVEDREMGKEQPQPQVRRPQPRPRSTPRPRLQLEERGRGGMKAPTGKGKWKEIPTQAKAPNRITVAGDKDKDRDNRPVPPPVEEEKGAASSSKGRGLGEAMDLS